MEVHKHLCTPPDHLLHQTILSIDSEAQKGDALLPVIITTLFP